MHTLLSSKMQEAIDSASRAGLEVTQETYRSVPALRITSPEVGGADYWVRLRAFRAIDPALTARNPRLSDIFVEFYVDDAIGWVTYPGKSRLDTGRLAQLWHRSVVELLYHDNPHALREEMALADLEPRGWYAQKILTHHLRHDDRIHGAPDYGDLCIAGSALAESPEVYLFRQTKGLTPVGGVSTYQGLSIEGARLCPLKETLEIHRSPGLFPFLRKFGPLTLAKLEQGRLPAHARLRLGAYQARVDAARASGGATQAHLDTLWRNTIARE